jgi:hypothetical protein
MAVIRQEIIISEHGLFDNASYQAVTEDQVATYTTTPRAMISVTAEIGHDGVTFRFTFPPDMPREEAERLTRQFVEQHYREASERAFLEHRERALREREYMYYGGRPQNIFNDGVRAPSLEASDRAKRLLMDNLSPDQRRDFQATGEFIVRTKTTAYKITSTYNFNVIQLNKKGEPFAALCVRPAVDDIPLYDQLLAQKLMLETDERGFLAAANKEPLATRALDHMRRAFDYGVFGNPPPSSGS